MFSLRKLVGGGTEKSKAGARPKARLACEVLEDRANPSWVPFTILLDNNVSGYGAVEYNHQEINGGDPWQFLEITDFIFYMNGQDITVWEMVGTADFEYGVFQGITIEGEFGGSVAFPNYTTLSINWTEAMATTWSWSGVGGTVVYGSPQQYPPFPL